MWHNWKFVVQALLSPIHTLKSQPCTLLVIMFHHNDVGYLCLKGNSSHKLGIKKRMALQFHKND